MSNEPKSLRSPTTQAGRALLDLLYRHHVTDDLDLSALDILAIEAEAAAAPAAAKRWVPLDPHTGMRIEPPSEPAAAAVAERSSPAAHAQMLVGYDPEKGYQFRDPNWSEPAAAEPPLYCGRCGHPMHWKQCDRDYLDGRCECRNDGERAAQPPSCPECGARYGD